MLGDAEVTIKQNLAWMFSGNLLKIITPKSLYTYKLLSVSFLEE